MACPTCDHTMHIIMQVPKTTFWCPRCGTLKDIIANGPDTIERPRLIARVRSLMEHLTDAQKDEARRLGIVEAIETESK